MFACANFLSTRGAVAPWNVTTLLESSATDVRLRGAWAFCAILRKRRRAGWSVEYDTTAALAAAFFSLVRVAPPGVSEVLLGMDLGESGLGDIAVSGVPVNVRCVRCVLFAARKLYAFYKFSGWLIGPCVECLVPFSLC
jgi:hypothetical protein